MDMRLLSNFPGISVGWNGDSGFPRVRAAMSVSTVIRGVGHFQVDPSAQEDVQQGSEEQQGKDRSPPYEVAGGLR